MGLNHPVINCICLLLIHQGAAPISDLASWHRFGQINDDDRSCLRVVVSGVVEVVADAGCDEDGHVLDGQPVDQATHVYETVHHLSDAEAVAEVVERVVPIVLLYAQLNAHKRRRHLAINSANVIVTSSHTTPA